MQVNHLRRREFISALGVAAAWSRGAWAQQSAMPVIGYIDAGSPEPAAHLVSAFRECRYYREAARSFARITSKRHEVRRAC